VTPTPMPVPSTRVTRRIQALVCWVKFMVRI